MRRGAQAGGSGHTILVVDDQSEVLESTRSLLEREGHAVLTADSGESALALLKEHDVHLLIVDYAMPRMGGDLLVREIRKFDPYVQIVMETGWNGDLPPRQMLRELDIQGYHDKTDGPEKLLLWVQVGLKAYRTIRQLRERERRSGELVAHVSHELKNPLGIIGGYAELLRDGGFGDLPERSLTPLRAMAGTTKMLNELVQNLLDYARIEAGAARVAPQQCSLQELSNEMKTLATFLLQEREVSFRVEPELTGAAAAFDVAKVRCILRNLVCNAAKFTTRGSITLRLDLAAGRLRAEVQDTGMGIPLEHQESIFEAFRQLDGSSTRSHGGIGLGLAVSRKLARLMGGDLAVESEVGVGSTFTLGLPASPAEQPKTLATASARQPIGILAA
jgi:signal transduction histidine kinase